MENASKAIMIAGGILLAIIIISVFIAMYNNIKVMATAEDKKKEAEELASFNAQYEAYNKKVMYGQDLLTVINKAIENNEKMQAIKKTDRHYIDIEFTLKTDCTTTGKKENSKTFEKSEMTNNDFKVAEIEKHVSLKSGTYNIIDLKTGKVEYDITVFFEQEKDVIKQTSQYTYYTYSGLATFKKMLFKAINIEYDDDGRVKRLAFDHIKIDEQITN